MSATFVCLTERMCPFLLTFFLQDAANSQKRTRDQIWKRIDHDYFGYRDDDDGILVAVEAEAEEKGALARPSLLSLLRCVFVPLKTTLSERWSRAG